ncbi:hypothetical protein DdX_18214 [Ditylenchus destructor]|uniref:Uncharacterized protein n=1 Tax=Ditylenchus destructor TaxID=166010 RepID=A0AAD4QYC7_9BILA|nr:hypothetical protein DdX_18214 [Ditylenchus destructor]
MGNGLPALGSGRVWCQSTAKLKAKRLAPKSAGTGWAGCRWPQVQMLPGADGPRCRWLQMQMAPGADGPRCRWLQMQMPQVQMGPGADDYI